MSINHRMPIHPSVARYNTNYARERFQSDTPANDDVNYELEVDLSENVGDLIEDIEEDAYPAYHGITLIPEVPPLDNDDVIITPRYYFGVNKSNLGLWANNDSAAEEIGGWIQANPLFMVGPNPNVGGDYNLDTPWYCAANNMDYYQNHRIYTGAPHESAGNATTKPDKFTVSGRFNYDANNTGLENKNGTLNFGVLNLMPSVGPAYSLGQDTLAGFERIVKTGTTSSAHSIEIERIPVDAPHDTITNFETALKTLEIAHHKHYMNDGTGLAYPSYFEDELIFMAPELEIPPTEAFSYSAVNWFSFINLLGALIGRLTTRVEQLESDYTPLSGLPTAVNDINTLLYQIYGTFSPSTVPGTTAGITTRLAAMGIADPLTANPGQIMTALETQSFIMDGQSHTGAQWWSILHRWLIVMGYLNDINYVW